MEVVNHMNFIYNGKFGGCEITPTEIKTKTGKFNKEGFTKWHESLNWDQLGKSIQTAFPYVKITTYTYGLVLTLGVKSYFVSSSDVGLDWIQNDSEFLNYSLKPYVSEKKVSELKEVPTIPTVSVVKETKVQSTVVLDKELNSSFESLRKTCESHGFFFNGWQKKQLQTLLSKSVTSEISLEQGSIFLKTVYDILLDKSNKSEYVPVGNDSYILGAFDMSFCIYNSDLQFIKGTCTECIKYKNWGTWSAFLTTVMPSFIKYLAKVQKMSVKCGGYDVINPYGKTIAEKKKMLEKQNIDATKNLEQLQTAVLSKALILSNRDKKLAATETKLNKKEKEQTNKNKRLEDPEFKRVVTVTRADKQSEMYKWYRARIELWVDYLRTLEGIKEVRTHYSKSTTSAYLYITGKNGKQVKISLRDHGNMSQESIYVILVYGFNLDGVHKDVLNLFNDTYKLKLDTNIPYIESKRAIFFKYLQVRKELAKESKSKDKKSDSVDVLDIFEKEEVQMGGIN